LFYSSDELKAATYEEFVDLSVAKDQKYNLDAWKYEDTNLFDEPLILKTIRELKTRNIQKLKQTLIDKCKNDLGGIENEKIYSQLHYGTKDCVDDYVDSMVHAMDTIGSSRLPIEEKYQFFKQIGHTYGRTALCLSGGATLTWFHCKNIFNRSGRIESIARTKIVTTNPNRSFGWVADGSHGMCTNR
jgi:hypothetical protein